MIESHLIIQDGTALIKKTVHIIISAMLSLIAGLAIVSCEVDRGPVPSEALWQEALTELCHQADNWIGFENAELVSAPNQIDFATTEGHWCVAIVARRSDSVGIYAVVAGQMNGLSELWYSFVGPTPTVLKGERMREYTRLAQHDSLWTLLGEEELWNNAAALRKLWEEKTMTERSDGNKTAWSYAVTLPGSNVRRATGLPSTRAAWRGDLARLAKREFGSPLLNRLGIQGENYYLDWFKTRGYWFAVVLRRGDGADAEIRSIVGNHWADSLEYRYVPQACYDLDEESFKNYHRLMQADSLWSIIGTEDAFRDRESLKSLYEKIGRPVRDGGGGEKRKVIIF